jgi:hypothetical protein
MRLSESLFGDGVISRTDLIVTINERGEVDLKHGHPSLK